MRSWTLPTAVFLSFGVGLAQDATPPPAKNYLNLSLDGLLAAGASTEPDIEGLQLGGHDPAQRGFTLQNLEVVFDGAVDPYFRGQANVILQITPDGETNVELEEAFATTSSLPANLQVKAGQYLTEFGRINASHPHAWDFVDQPIVSARMFGGDGLRSVGARLSWLMPTPFYSELFLSLQNARGETLTSFGGVEGDTVFGRPLGASDVKSGNDLLLTPRWSGSFELTDTQTLVVGASSASGPNGTGPDGKTRIDGVDAFWKWKSATAQKGFPFVKVQAEGMWRTYDAAATETLPAATFRDHGAYAQVLWGFKPGWVVGARVDAAGGDDGGAALEEPALDERTRYSLVATWYPTEYSKLRLQYSRDDRTAYADAHTVWAQFEFLLGAHAAHKF
jgi:hypothetical protein